MGTRVAACLIVALLAAVPLRAHHGNTDYDMVKLVTMKVTVTGFQFINPHSLISFKVNDPKGDDGEWQGEMPAPATLARRASWTRNTLKPGDQITVIGHCARNGSRAMQVVRVVLANGHELPGTEIPKEDQR